MFLIAALHRNNRRSVWFPHLLHEEDDVTGVHWAAASGGQAEKPPILLQGSHDSNRSNCYTDFLLLHVIENKFICAKLFLLKCTPCSWDILVYLVSRGVSEDLGIISKNFHFAKVVQSILLKIKKWVYKDNH